MKDSSIFQLISKILLICNFHDEIELFIEVYSQFSFGMISQAFCAALKVLMDEYLLFVNQLDNQLSKGTLSI